MARSYQDETKDLIASGRANKRADNKFGVAVRNVDQDPMDVNDVFTIPEDYEVLETSINGGDPVPFILIPITNSKTGVTRNFRFFPNMLAKAIYPIVNGRPAAKVKTVGSAALEYQKYSDKGPGGMDEAVKALIGKPIRITNKQAFVVKKYQSEEETTTNIYTYEFVTQ